MRSLTEESRRPDIAQSMCLRGYPDAYSLAATLRQTRIHVDVYLAA